jgi:REP element-mobilizing transposase RayT
VLYEKLRAELGEVFHRLAGQKESRIEEGHLMPDHVHMMVSIPPKHSVSQVVGYMKPESVPSGLRWCAQVDIPWNHRWLSKKWAVSRCVAARR